MRKVFTALCISLVYMAIAQTHQEAKQLLTDASDKIASYNNLYLEFTYNFENNRVDPPITQSEKGSIAVKGESYHLNFMGAEQIRNGNKLYTILKEDEEVQVTEYDEAEEDQGLTPSSILRLYQKGYSYKLGGTEKVDGKTIQYVILKPNASEDIDKIMIGVEKDTKKLYSLRQWGNNGTLTTFLITNFEPNKKLPASHFSFDRADYPGYYIAE